MGWIFFAVLFAGAAFAAGEREKRVDSIFAKYAKPGSPGCAVGVLEYGVTALAKGYCRYLKMPLR